MPYPSVSLLSGDMQWRQTLAVALIDNERTLLRVEQLSRRMVSTEARSEMQRTLVLVIFQIDASAEPNEVLQGANMSGAAGVVQRRASVDVFLIEQQLQMILRHCLRNLGGEALEPSTVHDDQVQNVAPIIVLNADVRAESNQIMHCFPAAARWRKQQRRSALLVQRVYVGALAHQILDNVRMIEHRRAVQRRHFLSIGASQAGFLLARLHGEHELNNVKGALREEVEQGGLRSMRYAKLLSIST